MNWLEDALGHGPLLGDGAMGTMLISAGLTLGSSAELWNLERPDAVRTVHRRYVESGCRFVTTNTFGANPLALDRHGLAELTGEINAAGVRLAREAAGDYAKVLGGFGPFGGFLEPYGEVTLDELRRSIHGQLDALLSAGVDGFIVETMVDPVELAEVVRAAKEAGAGPVLATFAFQKAGEDFRTLMGTTVEEAIAAASGAGADVVGANCGTGLSLADYLVLAARLVAASDGLPILLQPNAGAPRDSGDSFTYPASPEDLAEWVAEARAVGVSIVGGCCGTTPAHIAAMAEALYA